MHAGLFTYVLYHYNAADMARIQKSSLQSIVLETPRFLEYVGGNLTLKPRILGDQLPAAPFLGISHCFSHYMQSCHGVCWTDCADWNAK